MSPTVKDLRSFGLIMAGGISLFLGFLIPWVWHIPIRPIFFEIAAVFFILGQFYPISLKYLYMAWMKLGGVLGWINSRIILSFIFYLIIAPVGLFRRFFFGADPLRLKTEKNANSYRIGPDQHDRVSQMEKPY
jgi:hypothetical protein